MMPVSNAIAQSSNQTKNDRNIAVVFGDPNDINLKQAVNTLIEEIAGLFVVTYDSQAFTEIIRSTDIVNYIFVGHGSTQGILLGNDHVFEWKDLSFLANSLRFSGKVHFLNCNSASVDNLLPSSIRGITFTSDMDATIGALMVSLMINGANSGIQGILSRYNKIVSLINQLKSGLRVPQFLKLDDGGGGGGSTTPPPASSLSFWEGVYGLISMIVTVLMYAVFLYGIGAVVGKGASTIGKVFGGSGAKATGLRATFGVFKNNLMYLVGTASAAWNEIVEELAWSTTLIVMDSLELMLDAINQVGATMGWLDQIFLIASLVASILILIGSGGNSLLLGILAMLWPMWKVFSNIVSNANDQNDYWQDSPYSCEFDLICGF